MKHARIDTPDGFRIVHANATEPEVRDTAGPVLHLLPKLYVGPAVIAACLSPRVACTASIVSPARRWQMPLGSLVVRQALPNRCYLMAGTLDSRYGFTVPLPPTLPEEVVVRFEWRFTDAAQAATVRCLDGGNAAVVDHLIRLRLRPTGRGQVFSMDVTAWPDRDRGVLASCRQHPVAVLKADSLSDDVRQESLLARHDPATDALLLDEQLAVPGILLSDIWGLSEFADEQLHEVGQTTDFAPASADTLAHRANACVEMPAEVLVEAVRLARAIPYGEDTPYAGSMAACERHPALLALCGWWNRNAPDPLHRRAGLCGIDVRVRDDGEYWPTYYETPNRPVNFPVKSPEIAARIGDVVLVEFYQGQHAATYLGGHGCELWDVAGNPWQTVGVSEAEVRSGECDEGWYPLAGLAAFPERFPKAWEWLTGDDLPGLWDLCVDDAPAAAPEVPAAVEERIDSGHPAPRLHADMHSGSPGLSIWIARHPRRPARSKGRDRPCMPAWAGCCIGRVPTWPALAGSGPAAPNVWPSPFAP